jgi:hypothetical protein
MAAASAERVRKKNGEKIGIREQVNIILSDIVEKGRASSLKIDPKALSELERKGLEARSARMGKTTPVRPRPIIEVQPTQEAISSAMELAAMLESAKNRAGLNFGPWVSQSRKRSVV